LFLFFSINASVHGLILPQIVRNGQGYPGI
jgi:hypothetical protein